MKRIELTLCAVLVAFAAAAARAQTCQVAEMISPVPGSVLPAGAVTFEWCNANADYFLTVESVPGAHDIFFAFAGGPGGGGVTSITLGPDCAPVPPTGCIVPHGETIFVTLWTFRHGRVVPPSPFNYTYTAANLAPPPVATTTTVGDASVLFSGSEQSVPLTATVTAASTVNQGTVTFQVLDGATPIGAAVTSAALTDGGASVNYLLPAGTPANVYTVAASYSGGPSFPASSGSGTLTVNPAPPVALPTTTTVDPQTVTFSDAAQNVTVTATVSASSTVSEGTVTFQVLDAASNLVGSAVTSATLASGAASAIYGLPAGLAAGAYTIQAAYSGGTNFLASSGTGALTVSPTPPPTQVATSTTVGNNAVTFSGDAQNVTLSASVAAAPPPVGSPPVVNEGTITFQVTDAAGNPIGDPVPSPTVADGNAAVSYALPAGLPASAGGYTIRAAYSGGPDFQPSSGSGTLIVNKAQSTTTFTSTPPASLPLNGTYTPTAASNGDGTLTIGASGACTIAGGVVTITATSGTCTVTADESEGSNFLGSSATPQVITAVAPAVLLVVNPTTVIGGVPSAGNVTLANPAPAGGAVVALTSSDTSVVTVPASVTVAAGATSRTFSVTTKAVAAQDSVTVSASYSGSTFTAVLTVNPAVPTSLTVSPASVIGGKTSKGKVTLNGKAPSAGAVVALATADPSASVPATVTVSSGSTSATFTITTTPVATTAGPFNISASYQAVTLTAPLTVQQATVSRLTVSPSSVIGGTSSNGTVTLTGAAPAGGAAVILASANGAAGVPASVTVNAGATSATFPVSTTPVAVSTGAFAISATYNGVTRTDTLTVKAPAILSLTLNPTTVTGGNTSVGTVTLTGPAPSAGFVVALKSSNTAVATVLSAVTVAANDTTATFDVSTVPVAGSSTAKISATAGGSTKNATLTVTP